LKITIEKCNACNCPILCVNKQELGHVDGECYRIFGKTFLLVKIMESKNIINKSVCNELINTGLKNGL